MEGLADKDRLNQSEPMVRLLQRTNQTISRLKDALEDVWELSEECYEDIPPRFDTLLKKDEDILDSLTDLTAYEDYRKRLREITLDRTPPGTKQEKTYPYLDDIKDVHKMINAHLKELRDNDFLYPEKAILEENESLLPYMKEFARLVLRYEELFSKLKKEQNVYDFDDLEHMTLRLLVERYDENGLPVPSETALTLARNYKEIFVDEYQDTSMIQETILMALHPDGRNHLFTVGDIKQSIYRFRQARPDLFLNRQQTYTDVDELPDEKDTISEKSPKGINIGLTDNFRSAPDVLALCNKVFSSLMEEDFGGVCYDDKTALRVGAGSPMEEMSESSELLLLLEDDEKDHLSWEYDPLYAETLMIAGRVEELINEGYSYGDMVILLRSLTDRAETMAEYLRMLGIPALCESRKGYFHTREVGVILNYLAVVDNVFQDIPMASVLLSSIGGFTEEELALLKTQIAIPMREDYSFYELLTLYEDTGEDLELVEKVSAFLDQLSAFRKMKKEMPLHQLLWNIYQDTGFYYDVLLMSEGEKRRENLNMLLQKAEDYEKTVFKGLFYFIRYMDQLKYYEVELPESAGTGDEEDVLRIMSIHKSKGLEFPVVFVSRLSGQFNLTDTSQMLLYHPEFGMGLEIMDLKNRIHHPSLMKNMLKEQIKKESLEEELRILYVGMTRAQRKLILTGIVNEKMLEECQDIEPDLDYKMRARCFMDWVLPVMLKGDGDTDPAGEVPEEFDEAGRANAAEHKAVRIIHLNQLPAADDSGSIADNVKGSLQEFLDPISIPEDITPVENAFSYQYPYFGATRFKRKYSVSELKKLAMTAPAEDLAYQDRSYDEEMAAQPQAAELDIPVPDFLKEDKKIAPAARGTIVHKIMELLPFGQIEDKEGLYQALGRIKEEYRQSDLVSMKQVYAGAEKFLFSEEGEEIRRMDREGKLFKEAPFTISIPTSYLGKEDQPGESVIVQGIIDAYGETPEGLWLIDYKTDRIKAGEEELLLDRYRQQMVYYRTALEMLLKKPVVRVDIYSFVLEKFIPVDVF